MQKPSNSPYHFISTPSNCSVPFKKLKHLKTQSPNKSMDNKNRCKEVSIEVAKFLQQISKNESNITSMHSSNFEPRNVEESKSHQSSQLLLKQLELKSQEIETWKQKYEYVTKQMNEMKIKYDEDIKILSQEIEAVNERITSCEQQRNQSFFEQKATNLSNLSIQTFQRSFNENDHMNEQNKLLDEISEKNHTIQQLTHIIEKLKIETSELQLKCNSEVEQLKNQISQIQLDHQNQTSQIKGKLEFFSETQLQNQKSAYHNQIEILKEEIYQLKGLIDIKNQEVQTISNQNNKLKYQVDFEKSVLKQDIESYKMQLSLKEHQYQEDHQLFKENLETMHKNELNIIKEKYEKQIYVLETEIRNLKEFLQANNSEQQHLILEKLKQKEFYQVENQRLNNLIEEQNKRLLSQRQNTESSLGDKIQKITDLQKQYQQLLEESSIRIEQLSQENLGLKSQIVQQETELNKFDAIYGKLKDYEENLQKLEEENKLIISHFEIAEKQRQKEKEQSIFQLEQYYEGQLRQYQYQISTLMNDKRKYLQIIEVKDQEIYELSIELKNLQLSQQNIRIDNELLFSKLLTINNTQESQRNDAINSSVQFKRMSDQIGLLQNELMLKNQELTQMIEKYQNVEQSLCKSQIKQTDMNLNELMRKQIRKSSQILYQ